MGKLFRFHVLSVKGSCHHDKGTVSALRGFIAKVFIKIKELIEGRASHHVHDALVIFRTGGIEAVGAVFLQLMGKVTACHIYHVSFKRLRNSLDLHAEPVVLCQRETGKPDPDKLEARIFLQDKVKRHHDTVVKLPFSAAEIPGGNACLFRTFA